jgi:hypothetical protein
LSDHSFEGEQLITHRKTKKIITATYDEIPEVDQCRYVPEAFRHKFEICYWRIEESNIVKVNSFYFTPKVCNTCIINRISKIQIIIR